MRIYTAMIATPKITPATPAARGVRISSATVAASKVRSCGAAVGSGCWLTVEF